MIIAAKYFGTRLQAFMASPVASHTSAFRSLLCTAFILCIGILNVHAANYTVSDKTTLQSRMTSALPGDTVIVANGTYNWGQIVFTNNNGTSSSAWIVLKAETFRGVTFTGSTYLQFKGTRVMIDGFRFANGSAGTNPVISFRSSSSNLSHYCRITNIIIDNYNTYSADSSTENEWVALYGTNNRVDHCTFINKYNARATVVIWYSSTSYPNPAISTYHRIDSNYFNGRSYLGTNGGETIRVGDSNSSRTDGFNTIEYNLFEGLIQTEPEIISNKSDRNIYRYNTFKNSQGGLTLRHGRYCSVYGNCFIVDNPSVTQSYGIRVIDKGHVVVNNYIEAVNGNSSGGTSQLRAPINLYNGVSIDTTDPSYASTYFPADSCIVAFNTIVNAKGGGGIVLGGTGGGTIQPKGIILANNLVKMATGSAIYQNPANTLLTHTSEGNWYSAPAGLGIVASGWTSNTLNFGSRTNGILKAPDNVADASVNYLAYAALLQGLDVRGNTRSGIYDVGAEELNTASAVFSQPLDSTMVGAGKPQHITLPVNIVSFTAVAGNDHIVQLQWNVSSEINVKEYQVEYTSDGSINIAGTVAAAHQSSYQFTHAWPQAGNIRYRLKMIDTDGRYSFSKWVQLKKETAHNVKVYPNPAGQFITVTVFTTGSLLKLYNTAGHLVLQQQSKQPKEIIRVGHLPKGPYSMQVWIKGKLISVNPIIIQ